jgi:hypothetical protein
MKYKILLRKYIQENEILDFHGNEDLSQVLLDCDV